MFFEKEFMRDIAMHLLRMAFCLPTKVELRVPEDACALQFSVSADRKRVMQFFCTMAIVQRRSQCRRQIALSDLSSPNALHTGAVVYHRRL